MSNSSSQQGQPTMGNSDYARFNAELDIAKIYAEISHILADIRKKEAETSKISKETFWYPVLIATGLVGAIATLTAAITSLVIKFL